MELPSSEQLLSKVATNDGHGENSSYFEGWKAYDRDPYHPKRNPQGVIQMGLAENQLCHDLIEQWMWKNPEASICTAEGVSQFKAVANFQDYHGLPSFRLAVAKFMEIERGGRAKFDPARIVMSGGATGAQETLAFCLADPGDAFLIPIPYYPASDRDFCWRTRARLLPIHCDSSNNFKLTSSALHSALDDARRANIPVKGVLLANPSNPLGTTLDESTLLSLLRFTNAHRLHLICDEIFAGTVFSSSPSPFISIAEILLSHPSSADPNLIHIISSLSKNLGLPGFRAGLIYSYNDAVVACARKMSSFGLVSTQTQHLLAGMLRDEDFVRSFLAESGRRLRERRAFFVAGLERVGIRCLEGNGGLFCWMDLRPFLKEGSEEGELALWRMIVDDVKLNVSPGSAFRCEEPGWFRACFANVDEGTAEEALRRIRVFVDGASCDDRMAEKKTKRRRMDAGLRLSLPRRFEELAVVTPPRIMSPHSPLVHATI